MDHPLTKKEHQDLRKRVIDFLKKAYFAPRQSNVIFVCGGNKPTDMRKRFQQAFSSLLPGFEFFEPEFAMKNYFASGDDKPFDIVDFEQLIAKLSHSIVIFPEAPGSFAETGYFSAVDFIAKKTLLVIDAPRQKNDSFISLGPATKINETSIFHPNVNIDYLSPDFSIISSRIVQRSPLSRKMKTIELTRFKDLSEFDLMCLVFQIVSLLSIATISDINFLLRSLFKSHISETNIKKIISVLVGSRSLEEVGSFGHVKIADSNKHFWVLKEGWKTPEVDIRLNISTLYPNSDPEFIGVMRIAGYAS